MVSPSASKVQKEEVVLSTKTATMKKTHDVKLIIPFLTIHHNFSKPFHYTTIMNTNVSTPQLLLVAAIHWINYLDLLHQ